MWLKWSFAIQHSSQCKYAGPWCRDDGEDDRLISGSWYVENVREELDAPGEFFFDEVTEELFLWPNATRPDGRHDDGLAALAPPAGSLVVPQLQTLIRFKGTMAAPVKDVTISNLGFRDAAYTFMERFGVPSGGDWSLYRGGAVDVEGTEGLTIANSTFKRLDGNAIMLSAYNRNVSILRNEFVFVADNAIASWGTTNGYDGTAGDQPRGTLIKDNLAHELAFFEKQSSFYFQAKTCQATVTNNIVYNVPRAAINLNDGFGGDNLINSNLIFNTCRVSALCLCCPSDHNSSLNSERNEFSSPHSSSPYAARPLSSLLWNCRRVATTGR